MNILVLDNLYLGEILIPILDINGNTVVLRRVT